MKVAQSCPTLWDPMDCSLPDCSVHGILQARILEWLAIPRSQHSFPCLQSFDHALPSAWAILSSGSEIHLKISFSYANLIIIAVCVCVCVCLSVTQSCPTLWDPMDCSLPGSSVHGIPQARILEWVAIHSPGDLPEPGIKPRSPALQVDSLLTKPPGKAPIIIANNC